MDSLKDIAKSNCCPPLFLPSLLYFTWKEIKKGRAKSECYWHKWILLNFISIRFLHNWKLFWQPPTKGIINCFCTSRGIHFLCFISNNIAANFTQQFLKRHQISLPSVNLAFSPSSRIKAREAKTEQNKNKLPCPLCNTWGTSQVRYSRCLFFGNITSTTVRNQHQSCYSHQNLQSLDSSIWGFVFFPPDMTWRSLFSSCKATAYSRNNYKPLIYQWINSKGKRKINQGKQRSSRASLFQHVIRLQAALL